MNFEHRNRTLTVSNNHKIIIFRETKNFALLKLNFYYSRGRNLMMFLYKVSHHEYERKDENRFELVIIIQWCSFNNLLLFCIGWNYCRVGNELLITFTGIFNGLLPCFVQISIKEFKRIFWFSYWKKLFCVFIENFKANQIMLYAGCFLCLKI